jgi:cytochrome P450
MAPGTQLRVPPPPPHAGALGLGALRELHRDALGFFVATARACGDVALFRLGGMPVFQFTHPEHNYEILVEKQRAFRKSRRLKRVLGQWSGEGLALIDGVPWERQRRLVNPSFRADRLAAYQGVVLRHAQSLCAGWQQAGELDVSAGIHQLTFRVVAETLFGAGAEQHVDEFSRNVAMLNECALRELSAPFVAPLWLPTPHKRRLRAAARYLERVVYGFIHASREESARGQSAQAETARPHLLSSLLHSADAGGAMSDREAHDAIVNLLLGGNETTATGIVWTLYCLSRHPRAQGQLRLELEQVLGGAPPTVASLPRLRRLARAFQEALRLFPPAYAIPREAAEDVTIGGVHVPRGSMLNLVPYVTQRDARWFEQPDEFLPERFEHESQLPRGAYLPFGLGRRLCVGRGFAQIESLTVLALLLQRFELRPAPSQPQIELEAQISLHPRGGLRLELVPAPLGAGSVSPAAIGG